MPRSFRGYEVHEKIGSGGMSTLYKGLQTNLDRPVAIKILHPGLAGDESFITRFEREARAASALEHPNIVSVIDFGSEDDVYYIVMELVHGVDLRELLQRSGRIPLEVVLAILEEVAYGLEAAHEQGIVHRDIKPGNVLLSERGQVKIGDFGLARHMADVEQMTALTVPGSIIGTPAYMSPEQAAGRDVDQRTDIYSLGVVAYELITGEKPFQGETYSEVRVGIINRDPDPMRKWTPVTPEIEALVSRMLQKDPDRRFPAMRNVVRQLEDCMESLDPTGGLIKHRRKYLADFARDPQGFSETLHSRSIRAHLDRGYYFKKMGLSKIDDALREFRFVLLLDPQNERARTAIGELKSLADESGVRFPEADETRALPAAAAPVAPGEAARPVAEEASAAGEEATEVMPGEVSEAAQREAASAKDRSAEVKDEERARGRSRRRVGWLVAAGAIIVVAVLGWRYRAGLVSGPSGALVIESEPPGAEVYLQGPGDERPRATGRKTNCRLEGLRTGEWEVTLVLAGYTTDTRSATVGPGEGLLRVPLQRPVSEGRIAFVTQPPGATVRLRGPGETEFRLVEGVTPLTTRPLQAGDWEYQVEVANVGRVTRVLRVEPEAVHEVAVDVLAERDVGRIAVSSDPEGARISLRPAGASEFLPTGKRTPAELDSLPVGTWDVRVEREGYQPSTGQIAVMRGATGAASLTLAPIPARPPAASTTGSRAGDTPTPSLPPADGYFRIVIVPFGDVYLDGKLLHAQVGRAVVAARPNEEHTVELRHPAFASHVFRDVVVSPRDTTDLGRHEFSWGQIRVLCRPAVAANLVIDGTRTDWQTAYRGTIGAGRHRLAIEKEGFRAGKALLRRDDGSQQELPLSPQGEVEVDVPVSAEIILLFDLVESE